MSMRDVIHVITGRRQPVTLHTSRLTLRMPEPQDFSSFVQVRRANKAALQSVEPTWQPDALARSGYRRRMRYAQELWAQQQGLALFLFLKPELHLIGGITLSSLDRGRPGTGMVGYWLDGQRQGQGLMREALRELCRYAHHEAGLRRIEAAVLPENIPSIKLLTACGFIQEGLARSYLRINGMHQDHLLFARLHADPLMSE